MKRIVCVFVLLLFVGCTKVGYPPSKRVMSEAVKVTIVPDPSVTGKYRLECENCDSPADALRLDRGDWIAWTHTFADEDPLILEFSTAGDGTEAMANAALLFGLVNPNFLVSAAVYRGKWTWLRVGIDATYGRHEYGVHGMVYGDPPPGLIVCPPGQTCH